MSDAQFRLLMILTVIFSFLGGGVATLLRSEKQQLVTTLSKGELSLLVVLTILFATLGGAVSNLMVQAVLTDVRAHTTKIQDTVVARGFMLVDNEGKQRAYLGVGEHSAAGLYLYDPGGRQRSVMDVDENGMPQLAMTDRAKVVRLNIGVGKNGSRLALLDPAGKERLRMRVDKDGPSLELHRSQERVWHAP